jgi:hypothetical protein
MHGQQNIKLQHVWKNIVEQDTHEMTIWRMRIAC